MHFNSCKSGALLAVCHFILIGTGFSLVIGYFFFWAGIFLFAAFLICAFLLFYRLMRCSVSLKAHILRVEKGRWFPLVLRVSVNSITGVHILQTPIARRLNVCLCIVYTNSLAFVLPCIKFDDASRLCELAQSFGETP